MKFGLITGGNLVAVSIAHNRDLIILLISVIIINLIAGKQKNMQIRE